MDEEKSGDGVDSSAPLYDWWFEALPVLFGAAGTGPAAREPAPAAAPGDGAAPATLAATHVAPALKLAQQLLGSVFSHYFGALVGQPNGAPLAAFEDMLRSGLARLGESSASLGHALTGTAMIDAALAGVSDGQKHSLADLLKPLSLNIERTYGGVADAFGLAPVRDLEAAGRDLALAAIAQRRAQAEYMDVALNAARQGVDRLLARLAEMGERGESVDSMLALMRLCATSMDGALHEAMQSPRGLKVSAEAVRAALRARQQQHRFVAIASEALNVPTRAEVDEAYREIQALKREVRRLRKGALATGDETPHAHADSNGQATRASPTPRARKPAAAERKPTRRAAAA